MLFRKINIYVLIIISSPSFGQPQLSLIYQDTSIIVSDIHAFNQDTVIFVAPPYIIRTIDGGISWETRYADHNLREGDFLPSGIGAICDINAGLLRKTNDYGATWDSLQTSVPSQYDIQVLDSLTYLMSIPYGYVVRSTDAGVTWDSSMQFIDPGSSIPLSLTTFSFHSSSSGFLCGGGLSTIHTNDSGLSWVIKNTGVPGFRITEASFINDLFGWAVDHEPHAFQHLTFTNDGGVNWYLPAVPPNPLNMLFDKFKSVSFLNNGVGLVCNTGSIYVTNNFGSNWYLLNILSPQYGMYQIKIVNDSIAYAGGFNAIYKLTNFLQAVNVVEANAISKVTVFPTITDNSLMITLNNVEKTNLVFYLFDAVGNEVIKVPIVDDQSSISIRDISSGMYFAKISNQHIIYTSIIVKL